MRRYVRDLWDRLILGRPDRLDLVLSRLSTMEARQMAADRDVLVAIAAGLEALAPELDNLVSRNQRLAAQVAELSDTAQSDEQDDAAAAQPLLDLVNTMRDKLSPVTPSVPGGPPEAEQQVASAPDLSADDTEV